MAVCVIMDAFSDAPEDWRFLKDDEFDGEGDGDENRTFSNSALADRWIEQNARNGWYTLIVGEDD